ncbi:MAG TPA: Nif3-like dinuclear metal center hexameric protein [Flavobacteriales bacterium]|mgnify:CR=1 FL=1|nr:Nif3-like dinuclear metal center hexameric protein [Flavobacteriales bacterium]
MKIQDVITCLEEWAPPVYQEDYDNSGLIVGDRNAEVKGVLVCLDSIEPVVGEAIAKGCNLIVAHHPILFGGITSLTGSTYVERVLLKAIKNDIAIYAIHTNLDNVFSGVNNEISNRLGLVNRSILSPKKNCFTKLITFVPSQHAENLRTALFKAGGGEIGEYSNCSYNTEGYGTFQPNDKTNPAIGEVGKLNQELETKVEVLVRNLALKDVLSALFNAHPYEEVAYDLIPLLNSDATIGSGMVGDLDKEMPVGDFLSRLKDIFNVGALKHTSLENHSRIRRIAVCGGSGSFLLNEAIARNADVFISSDFKYHQFFDADGRIVIADIGHYESEQFTIGLIGRRLTEKFTTFAVHFTEVNTNPINYL